MWQGTIESINIADGAKEPMRAIAEVRALPGVGLEGDRYALGQGTFSKPEPSHELTLIEAEAIEALSRDCAIQLAPGDARYIHEVLDQLQLRFPGALDRLSCLSDLHVLAVL